MRLTFAGLALAGLVVAGCGQNEPQLFEQAGYFKSDVSDRIFTIVIQGNAREDEALERARQAAHTPGQMTAVYFFDQSSAAVPRDGVTTAQNLMAANEVLYQRSTSRWRYAYMRDRQGREQFVDCMDETAHELCRG